MMIELNREYPHSTLKYWYLRDEFKEYLSYTKVSWFLSNFSECVKIKIIFNKI